MTTRLYHEGPGDELHRVCIGHLTIWYSYGIPIVCQGGRRGMFAREHHLGGCDIKHMNTIIKTDTPMYPDGVFEEMVQREIRAEVI